MAKKATKKPARKKLTLSKQTVRKLSDKPGGGGRQADSYRTCNMMCNTDPSACGSCKDC